MAQAKALSRNATISEIFLFLSIHRLQSNWCENERYGLSKAGVRYSKRTLLGESMFHSKCLSGSANVRCT